MMPRMRNLLGFFYFIPRFIRKKFHLFSAGPKGFLKVLLYHDIPPHFHDTFRSHITLAHRIYNFIDIVEFEQMMSGLIPIHGENILLTFDDGFKSNRSIAEQILDPLGIKALFFVTTDFLDCNARNDQKEFVAQKIFEGKISSEDIPDYLSPLSWSDLEILLENGHTIGSHTKSHRRLSEITRASELEEEIVGSRAILHKKLGVEIKNFAYPFGDFKSINTEAALCAQKHYLYAFSGVRGENHPKIVRYLLRRESLSIEDSAPYMRFIIDGGLSWYYSHKRKYLDSMGETIET
ncbi:MAG: polysaccharide deacetylase family protein [Candidatus Eremiobacteraeota bacterium]|nr:polysaccharide deacetylase family protein [Candidatus Eremiobacteraeota bacterium]